MLVPCPECEHRVSEHAPACPNCGFPIATERDLRGATSSGADDEAGSSGEADLAFASQDAVPPTEAKECLAEHQPEPKRSGGLTVLAPVLGVVCWLGASLIGRGCGRFVADAVVRPAKREASALLARHEPQRIELPELYQRLSFTVPSELPTLQVDDTKLPANVEQAPEKATAYYGGHAKFQVQLIAGKLLAGVAYDMDLGADSSIAAMRDSAPDIRELARTKQLVGGAPSLKVLAVVSEQPPQYLRAQFVVKGNRVFMIIVIGSDLHDLDVGPVQTMIDSMTFPTAGRISVIPAGSPCGFHSPRNSPAG